MIIKDDRYRLIWRYFLGHKIVIQPLIFVAGLTNEKLVSNRAELLNILKKKYRLWNL